MKKAPLISLALAGAIFASTAAQAVTSLNYYSSGGELRPFYWTEDGMQQGIIPDIFATLPEYELNFISAPRKRIDHFIENNQIDIVMMHPKYTKVPHLLNFVPLQFSQRNTIFTRKDNKQEFSGLNRITQTSICARDGYVYINMKERWKSQSLRRENLRSNIKVLQMLNFKRCEFAIGSDLSLSYLIKNHQYDNIVDTGITVNEVPRFLAISKRFPKLKSTLEKHMVKLKKSGKLAEIIKKYTP
ncbi:transporter substrate-binding domain-containing protein [Terasakiella sp. SH-1]|uniref:substrate-binding periplasmic protein n=1 Tax=Terasakiella sp. SH-1 TaxID=2560057 RepID=UPI001073C7E4|nr:transporter substrate-binding domain-containing protein [Terasakiella sp. SH-1]